MMTEHRPFPLPQRKWFMLQTWQDLLFLHWPVSVESLCSLIPPCLEIDTYQGKAWVSIVAFRMKDIRLRAIPISLFPAFTEINLRTYVKFGEKAGVYFISLDASNWLALSLVQTFFYLPYSHADILTKSKNKAILYESKRKHTIAQPVEFHAECMPVSDVYYAEQGTLDHWLTERYCFYCFDLKQQIYCVTYIISLGLCKRLKQTSTKTLF